jgi:DNA polymerase-1
VFHNWSFDSHVFANHGVSVKGFAGDTMHMARLFDSSRSLLSGGGGYKLSALCQDFLGWGKTDMKVGLGEPRTNCETYADLCGRMRTYADVC